MKAPVTVADLLEPNEELFGMALHPGDLLKLPAKEREGFYRMTVGDEECEVKLYRIPSDGLWTLAQRWIPHYLQLEDGSMFELSLLIDKVPMTEPPRVAPTFPLKTVDKRH